MTGLPSFITNSPLLKSKSNVFFIIRLLLSQQTCCRCHTAIKLLLFQGICIPYDCPSLVFHKYQRPIFISLSSSKILFPSCITSFGRDIILPNIGVYDDGLSLAFMCLAKSVTPLISLFLSTKKSDYLSNRLYILIFFF